MSANASGNVVAPARATMAGMSCVDTSGSPRLPILMEMVGGLSRATTPQEVLREFSLGLFKLEGPRGYVSLSTRGLRPGQYRITRLITSDDVIQLDEGDPWHDRNHFPVYEGGFFGAIIRQAYPEIIHNFYLRNDPIVGNALRNYGSLMAIPLFDNGEPLNWAIMLRKDPEGFAVKNLEDAILRGNLVGSTVRNVLAAQELRVAHDRIRREVEQIAEIQRVLLPRDLPKIAGVTLAASYEVYDQAGGDYYDFLPLGVTDSEGVADANDPWAIIVADAAGHGPAAAVLMAMLHAILHAFPRTPSADLQPGAVLAHLNRHLWKKGIESSFVTAFLAIYDPKSRTLRYARAGHPPPVVKDAGPGGAVRRLDAVGSLPLGIIDDASYDNASITLQPGQTLVLYTDGITEAMSPEQRMFGVEGIERALHLCTGMPECVQQSIGQHLREHENGTRPSDDQTLVAMRVEED